MTYLVPLGGPGFGDPARLASLAPAFLPERYQHVAGGPCSMVSHKKNEIIAALGDWPRWMQGQNAPA